MVFNGLCVLWVDLHDSKDDLVTWKWQHLGSIFANTVWSAFLYRCYIALELEIYWQESFTHPLFCHDLNVSLISCFLAVGILFELCFNWQILEFMRLCDQYNVHSWDLHNWNPRPGPWILQHDWSIWRLHFPNYRLRSPRLHWTSLLPVLPHDRNELGRHGDAIFRAISDLWKATGSDQKTTEQNQ